MTVYAGQRTVASMYNQSYGAADGAITLVTQTAFTNLSSVYTIPAGEAVAGSAYELECAGICQWGSTAQTLGIASSLNNAAPSAWTGVAAGSFSASLAISWWVRLRLVCVDGASQWQEILSGGFAPASAYVQPGTAAANGVPITHQQGDTASTASPVQVAIQAKWLSTTGGPSIQGLMTTFRRIA